MTCSNSAEEQNADEIDFSEIFAILWKRRKLIVFGTLGATLLSIGIIFLLPKVYRSEGFYQLGNPINQLGNPINMISDKKPPTPKKTVSIGVPLPLYKSGSSQFFNPNRLQSFAGKNKSFKEEILIKIETNFRTAADISKWFKPVYAFSKEDSREFAQLPQDASNSVIGMNLAYEADSPEIASTLVEYFGAYIRDCLMYVTLYNYIMEGYSSTISTMNKNENDIIGFQFELLQNTNKLKDIRAILSNYPESEKLENRQLVSVQEGGARFLAPLTQLVGIESTLADVRRELVRLERDREKLSVLSEYFSRCYRESTKIGEDGQSLYIMMKSIKEDIFKNKNLNKDEVKEVFNDLSIDLQAFDLNFFSNSRFISGPTLPTSHFKPRKGLITIVSCTASFLILITFAFVTHWWQGNKKTIMSGSRLKA